MPFSLLEEFSATSSIQTSLIAQFPFRQHGSFNWYVVDMGHLVGILDGTQHLQCLCYDIASQTASHRVWQMSRELVVNQVLPNINNSIKPGRQK